MSVTDVETAAAGRVELEESSAHAPLAPTTRVEVRSSFDQRWSTGFEVLEAAEDGYRLRRLSDGAALPATFSRDDIRRERKRGQWWY
ncbi:MAG: hypothetical protein HYX32_01435 [Actinobacteria bacterium]|nr:hypothetical protein [Actinomycetota bacterium]